MKKIKFFYLLAIATFSLQICYLAAQEGIKYLPLGNIIYDYFDYQINSRKIIPKFALRQPYELDRDVSITKKDGRIDQYFFQYWKKFYNKNQVCVNLFFEDFLAKDKAYINRFKAQGGGLYTSNYLTLVNQTAINQDYKRDQYFAGDLSESKHWLYGRVNEAYFNFAFKNFDMFFGRTKRNWGALGEKSLILSDNPYSYDHLLINYTADHLKMSLIFAQLENLDAWEFAEQKGDIGFVENARKYLVGHRFDLRLSDNLQVGLTEMATYGGKDRDIELAFLNPMNFYYGIQRNDRKQMDGFWALDIFYKPLQRITFYGQFLIDDIIVNNEPGINDRAQYPDRWALTLSLRSGDLFFAGTNVALTYTRVWNRTYQSKFTWENYHYRGLGLGYPCASCEEFRFKFAFWGWFPLYFSNELLFGRYGDVSLTDLFLLTKESFPIDPVTHNLINEFQVNYFYNKNVRFFSAIIYRDKPNHYSNRYNEKSNVTLKIGAEITLTEGIHLD